jgi:hypothetical protein
MNKSNIETDADDFNIMNLSTQEEEQVEHELMVKRVENM